MRTIRSSFALATIACLVAALLPAHAALPVPEVATPPGPEAAAPAVEPTDVEAARATLVRLLAENGLEAGDAEAFADQLTDEDLLHFAAHPDHVNAAGAVPEYIWILLGIFLGVLILAAIF